MPNSGYFLTKEAFIPDLREQEVGLHQVEPRGLREDEGGRPSPT
jgi:hypothetical protein